MRPNRYAWGLLDQGFSSGTNFGLAILAARSLGPRGLAALMLGFAVCQLALNLQRGMVTDPLLASATGEEPLQLSAAAKAALTVVMTWSLITATVAVAGGIALGGGYGRGIAAIGVWVPLVLTQDLWRALLFRAGRAAGAALNDGLWAATMLVCLPFVWSGASVWAVAACWGAGALVGALAGAVQTRVGAISPSEAMRWWRRGPAQLGRWLGLEEAASALTAYATAFTLAGLLGATSYGGFRAVQTAFGPLSLLVPAVMLPGLPAVTRAQAVSPRAARMLALRLSALVTGLTAIYVTTVSLAPSLLPLLFGSGFRRFHALILPIGLEQVVIATATGPVVLLTARWRGRALLSSRAVGLVLKLAVSTSLAAMASLTTLAWGLVFAAVPSTCLLVGTALWPDLGQTGSPRRAVAEV